MNPPTIEEIQKAYEKTGLAPCQNKFIMVRGDKVCACPISVLAIERTSYKTYFRYVGKQTRTVIEKLAITLGCETKNIDAFIVGFDGLFFYKRPSWVESQWEWFQRGCEARELLK